MCSCTTVYLPICFLSLSLLLLFPPLLATQAATRTRYLRGARAVRRDAPRVLVSRPRAAPRSSTPPLMLGSWARAFGTRCVVPVRARGSSSGRDAALLTGIVGRPSAQFPRCVRPSYAVAFGYCVADAACATYGVLSRGEGEAAGNAERAKEAEAVIAGVDTLLWQGERRGRGGGANERESRCGSSLRRLSRAGLASVAIPGAVINGEPGGIAFEPCFVAPFSVDSTCFPCFVLLCVLPEPAGVVRAGRWAVTARGACGEPTSERQWHRRLSFPLVSQAWRCRRWRCDGCRRPRGSAPFRSSSRPSTSSSTSLWIIPRGSCFVPMTETRHITPEATRVVFQACEITSTQLSMMKVGEL